MAGTRRRYSKAEKADAVGLALGRNTKAASEQLDIPRSTIRGWIESPEFASLRHRARDTVAEEMWAGVQVGMRAVIDGFRDPDAPLRDKAQALGILYDRFALLTGGATTRSENRDITGTLSDADVAALVREAEQITGGGGTAEAPAGEAAG